MSLTAFFPTPVTFFVVTYVLVLATQGTTGGVMQVLGTDLAPPFARGRFFAIWRPIAQLRSTVTPAIFAGIAEHAGYGYGFLTVPHRCMAHQCVVDQHPCRCPY